jgi:hypothetical protein
MDRQKLRARIFELLREFADDDTNLKTLINLVEHCGTEPLTDNAKIEWANLMDGLGISIKFNSVGGL